LGQEGDLRSPAQQHHPDLWSLEADLCGEVEYDLAVDAGTDNDQQLTLVGGQGPGDHLGSFDVLHPVPEDDTVGLHRPRVGVPQNGHRAPVMMRVGRCGPTQS